MFGGQFEITAPQGEDEDAGYSGSAEDDAGVGGGAGFGGVGGLRPAAARLNRLREKLFSDAAFPQRLEAALDSAPVAARVELVPFPIVRYTEFLAACKSEPSQNLFDRFF